MGQPPPANEECRKRGLTAARGTDNQSQETLWQSNQLQLQLQLQFLFGMYSGKQPRQHTQLTPPAARKRGKQRQEPEEDYRRMRARAVLVLIGAGLFLSPPGNKEVVIICMIFV